MSQDKSRASSSNRTSTWVHLGASGVLQPLSEEFLYRSPSGRAGLVRQRPRFLCEGQKDADV